MGRHYRIMTLLRIALASNGVLMFAWSFVLFFKHYALWAKGEGRKVADSKTKFDVMIWRIVGLWVAFVGLTCMVATGLPRRGYARSGNMGQVPSARAKRGKRMAEGSIRQHVPWHALSTGRGSMKQ